MKKLRLRLFGAVIGLALPFAAANAAILQVGTSWSGTPYADIQNAVAAAADTGDEIWVEQGTYVLTNSIVIDKSLAVYGGFDGAETLREERDWTNQVTVVDGNDTFRCFHVANGNHATVTLDGLTITRGIPSDGENGPAIWNGMNGTYFGSLTVAHCIITNNNGNIKHGAVFNDWGNFTAVDCTFANNTAVNKGGAILNYGHDLTLVRCLFSSNSANNGGAVSFPNTAGSPSATNHNVITDCVFSNNYAAMDGSALLTDGNMSLTRCTFVGNRGSRNGTIATRGDTGFSQTWTNCLFVGNSTKYGGAICINGSSGPLGVIRAVNCTFASNTPITGSKGGALYTMKPSTNANSVFEVVNCIFWGNFTNAIDRSGTTQPLPWVSYSDIDQAGYTGSNGNINSDPLFVDAAGGDCHLQAASPCNDLGTSVNAPADDLDQLTRPQGAAWDMGAYEIEVEGLSLETRPATDVEAVSATLVGNLTSDGGAPTTVYAFWGSNLVSTLPLDTDTYLDYGKPTNNYGASGSAKVVASTTPCRTLFTLPAALWTNDMAQVVSATVTFYTWSDNTSTQNIRLYPLTRTFTESGATWNTYDGATAWTTSGGDYDAGASVQGAKGALGVYGSDPNGRYFTWDITALLADPATRAELQNFGALLDAGTASPQRYATFNSSDKTGYPPEYLPFLTLTLASPTTGQSADLGVCAEGELTHAVSGLQPNTGYSFTFLASNSAGTAWAPAVGVFTTAQLGVEVSASTVNVHEAGEGRFFVRLNHNPGNSVSVNISRSSGDTNVTILSGTTRTFKASNWNAWQAITLGAAADANATNETATFQVSMTGAASQSVTATALDDDIGENFALASGGSTISGTGANRAAQMIDGLHTSSTNYGLTVWTNDPQGFVTLDLKRTTYLSRIRLLNWNWVYRVHRYQVESSTDGVIWSLLLDTSDADRQGWDDWSVANVAARYLRFTGLSNSANAYVVLSELEVYGARAPLSQVELSRADVNVREASSGRFFVRLPGAPTGNVVVTISRYSGAESITVAAGASRGFKPSNWNAWQAVVLQQAADDGNSAGETAVFKVSAPGYEDVFMNATTLDDDIGENLALASGGATITYWKGGQAAKLIDGLHAGSANYGWTYWTNTPPGTITLDMKAQMTVSRVRVLGWDWVYRLQGYQIEASTDGLSWTTLVDASTTRHGWDDWPVADETIRYLRFTGLTNTANSTVCISELEVYGTRPTGRRALAGQVTKPEPVTVVTSDDVAPTYESGWAAVDGDPATGWTGQKAGGGYILVSYAPALQLKTLEVELTEDSLTHIEYLYSRDGQSWQPLPEDMEQNPVSLNFLWLVFPDDGTEVLPRVLEIVPNP